MSPGPAALLVASCVDVLRGQLAAHGHKVATGQFGADMAVSLVNDGPVTLFLDSDDVQGARDG